MSLRNSETPDPSVKESSHSHLKFAKTLSIFASAPVLSIPAFLLIIGYHQNQQSDLLLDIFVSIIFGFVLPLLVSLSFSKKNNVSYDQREARIKPLLYVSATYIFGSFILGVISAPINAILLMFCYGTNTFAVYIINLRWKISIHAMGVAGPTTALIYSFGPVGGFMGLILLPVMWSRLYLKKHTPAQLIAGASLGYLLTSIQFFVLTLVLFNIPTKLLLNSLAILSLMLPTIIPVFYRFSANKIANYLPIVGLAIIMSLFLLWSRQSDLIFLLLSSALATIFIFWLLPEAEVKKIKYT